MLVNSGKPALVSDSDDKEDNGNEELDFNEDEDSFGIVSTRKLRDNE